MRLILITALLVTSIPASAQSNAADCQAGINRVNSEIGARGAMPSNIGAVAGYQMVIYATSRLLKVMDASCQGLPQYESYDQYKQAYDVARRSCFQSALDSSTCVPRMSW